MNWENLIEILIPERRSKMVDLTDAQFACNQTNSTSNNVFLKKLNSNDPDTIFNKVIWIDELRYNFYSRLIIPIPW